MKKTYRAKIYTRNATFVTLPSTLESVTSAIVEFAKMPTYMGSHIEEYIHGIGWVVFEEEAAPCNV